MLFKFGKVISPRCSFCKLHKETITYLFYDFLIVKRIWNQLRSMLSNNLNFLISTPQSAIFRLWDLDTNGHLILNRLLLIFKMYILNISHLLDTEKKLCENDANRRKKFTKKCKNVLTN